MKKFLSLLLAAAMLCTLLVGCGSKNNDSNGDYKPFVEVQGVSDDTILVGNTAATTGAYATVGVPFNAGMEAAFKAYNDAGGFQGKSIVLKHYDDGFDGAQGMTYTKQLVETDKVFAIVGHFGTNTVGATLDYLKEKGVPMVYAATGIDDLYQEGAKGNDAVIYSVQPIYSAEGRVLLARAVAPKADGMGLGGTKVGVIATTDDAGAGLLAGVKRENEDLKAQLTVQEVEASATDFSAAVNVLKNALGAFVDSGAITDSRMVYCTAWLDVTTEAGMADYTTFYTAMSAWELANGESGSTYALNSYAMAGYIAGSIFVQALQAVDKAGLELNYANFAKIMEETEFSIPMGGTISYAGGDRLGVTALALNCVSLSKNDAGVYALTPVSPIMSLADVVAAIK